MIAIHRVYSTALPVDRDRVAQVQEIFRENFPSESAYAEKIPAHLDKPFNVGYSSVLLVGEKKCGTVGGFSLFIHFPEINSSLLDFLAVRTGVKGGGLGGALYEATRDHLRGAGSRGLFMEVLPDDPQSVRNPRELEANRRRLAFYERYALRPIVGTAYETPIGDSPAPHLLFDGLGRKEPLSRAEARAAVRLILTRKYGHLIEADYIERVVESFGDNPVRFRPPRYVRSPKLEISVKHSRLQQAWALVASDRHVVHHVNDRGYVERPARVGALVEALIPLNLFETIKPSHFGEDTIRAVHDTDFVSYLRNMCARLESPRPVYPYVFPIRRPDRKPRDMAVRAGYYCIDTFTPLDRNAWEAARAAVDVALTGARLIAQGKHRLAYALCRPPGHHAERRVFGGFCYFNNAAIAAHQLSRLGQVAILDIDYHHGNGTQDIFYERADVLTISIHGHPNEAYPYFSGFADEHGAGPGQGFNTNYPLPDHAGEETFLAALTKALVRLRAFRPTSLVISLGFDTMKGDPTGTFDLSPKSMRETGRRLGELGLPTLVVQEGGYSLRNLRRGGVAFFEGLADAMAPRFGDPKKKQGTSCKSE